LFLCILKAFWLWNLGLEVPQRVEFLAQSLEGTLSN